VDVTEVWLAAGAPPGLTGALARRGVAVVGADSMETARARYAGSGPAALVRYQLLAALMAQILVAAALLLAAAVERPARVREFAVLRAQGLSALTARRAGLWSYAPLCLVAVLVGLLAAVAARALVGAGPPAVAAPAAGAATALSGLAVWAGALLATVAVAVAVVVTLLGRAVGRTLRNLT
jgi:putative ABC transport system permease protein